jgi:hypothetical protein
MSPDATVVYGYEVRNIKLQPGYNKRSMKSSHVVRNGRGLRIAITVHYALVLMSQHGHPGAHLTEHKTWESALSYAMACASEVRSEQRRRAAKPAVATAVEGAQVDNCVGRCGETLRPPALDAPERSATPYGDSLLERATAARRTREIGGGAAMATRLIDDDDKSDDEDEEAL